MSSKINKLKLIKREENRLNKQVESNIEKCTQTKCISILNPFHFKLNENNISNTNFRTNIYKEQRRTPIFSPNQRNYSTDSNKPLQTELHFPKSVNLNKTIINRLITGEYTPKLSENIIYNEDTQSNFTHIELSNKYVQFEYKNTKSIDFQERAKIYFLNEEEIKEKNIPIFLIPAKVINLTNVGGGASIYYLRNDISNYLKNIISNTQQNNLIHIDNNNDDNDNDNNNDSINLIYDFNIENNNCNYNNDINKNDNNINEDNKLNNDNNKE